MLPFRALGLCGCFAVTLLSVDTSIRAADPEQILAQKGLKRSGVCYLIKDHENRIAEQNRLVRAGENLQAEHWLRQEQLPAARARVQFLQDRLFRLNSEIESLLGKKFDDVKDAKGNVTNSARDQERERDSQVRQMERDQGSYNQELPEATKSIGVIEQRIEATVQEYNLVGKQYQASIEQIQQVYSNLSIDPEVKDALKALNAESKTKFVLGPVAGFAEYKFALRSNAAEDLKAKGLILEPDRNQFLVKGEREVMALAYKLRQLSQDLAKLQTPPTAQKSAFADMAKKLKIKTEELAKADPAQRKRKQAELDLVKGQIEVLKQKGITSEQQEKVEAANQKKNSIDDKRRARSESRLKLRALVEETETLRKKIQADPEIKRAIDALNASRTKPVKAPFKVAILPDYTKAIKDLEKSEKDPAPETTVPAAPKSGSHP